MKSARVLALIAVVTFSPAMTSCWPFKRAKAKPPASTPVPAQVPQPQPAPIEQPPPTEAPEPAPVEQPKPAPEAPVQKRPSPAGPPVQPTPPAPPPAPVPQLRQILTPAQRRQLNRSIDERISRAARTLAALEGRTLSREQVAAANQIRTFLRQAEEARKSDLVRANNLAERADVLAQDLMRRIR
jgi:outer membrane biosynthesis protein TonB